MGLLQQLFMIPAFRTKVLACRHLSGVDCKTEKSRHNMQSSLTFEKESMIIQLQYLFSSLLLSQRRSHNPTNFCYAFKDEDGLPTNVHIQKDANEFLQRLCARI